jgi:hypothetical protein
MPERPVIVVPVEEKDGEPVAAIFIDLACNYITYRRIFEMPILQSGSTPKRHVEHFDVCFN